jgi:hypothetical protein
VPTLRQIKAFGEFDGVILLSQHLDRASGAEPTLPFSGFLSLVLSSPYAYSSTPGCLNPATCPCPVQNSTVFNSANSTSARAATASSD